MATPGELAAGMATILGIPAATLALHDKQLKDAGLRSKGGRGRSAAKVSTTDAARLLVAALASQQVKDSAFSVTRYAETRPDGPRSSPRLFAKCGIRELATLPHEHSFIDALDALLQAAATGTLSGVTQRFAAARSGASSSLPSIEVSLLSPGTLGELRIANIGSPERHAVRYMFPDPFTGRSNPSTRALREWEAKLRALRIDSDRRVSTQVFERTVFRIAVLLRDRGGNNGKRNAHRTGR